MERAVPFVRNSFFAGESFLDLPDAQRRAVVWCEQWAGMRIHGTIEARPAEVFRVEGQPQLRPAPAERYDLPIYATLKVYRDITSTSAGPCTRCPQPGRPACPGPPRLAAGARVFSRGQLVKVHTRQPIGKRSTDPADLPAERIAHAVRDLDQLQRLAAGHVAAIVGYAAALLEHPPSGDLLSDL